MRRNPPSRPLDRAAVLEQLSASAPDASDPSERASRPVTTLDVLAMQVRGIMHQCATVLATIDSMQRRPIADDDPNEAPERPATFGRKQPTPDAETPHGEA